MRVSIAAAAAVGFWTVAAVAGTVDLSSRTAERGGTWSVAPSHVSVTQTRNSSTPAVFYDKAKPPRRQALSGTIRVDTARDDDYVAFVLGYQPGEMGAPLPDYWIVDWRQGPTNGAPKGLALSHVTAAYPGGTTGSNLWKKNRGVSVVARGKTLGGTGWADLTAYSFNIVQTPWLIEVFVNGVREIAHTGRFNTGALGLYNFSQMGVTYADVARETPPPSPVPLPAGLPLLAAALAFIALLRRRRL